MISNLLLCKISIQSLRLLRASAPIDLESYVTSDRIIIEYKASKFCNQKCPDLPDTCIKAINWQK